MELNDYQVAARATANYPRNELRVVYPLLGLMGETGEVAEKVFSIIVPGTDDTTRKVLRTMLTAIVNAKESEALKKSLRKGEVKADVGIAADIDVEGIVKEMGDVLWYLASLADDLGVTLDNVAKTNIKKLADRAARGVIKGEGDNR